MPRVTKNPSFDVLDDADASPPTDAHSCPCEQQLDGVRDADDSEPADTAHTGQDKKKRKQRTYRASSDPGPKTKRTPNAFMLFSKEQRAQYDTKTMKVTEVAKDIGKKWHALEEEEKSRYKQMAIDLKANAEK